MLLAWDETWKFSGIWSCNIFFIIYGSSFYGLYVYMELDVPKGCQQRISYSYTSFLQLVSYKCCLFNHNVEGYFFSAIVLIYVLILYEACRSEQPQISTKFMVWFVIISFLVCSFRSNGLFIWIFSIFFLFYTFRSEWKKLTIMFIGVMSLFLLYKGCLQIVQIQDADIIE